MIFSRSGRTAGRHARDNRSAADAQRPPGSERSDAASAQAGAAPVEPGNATRDAGPARSGPFDVSEAPSGVRRLDLGSLQIPSVPGVEVRAQFNPDGVVQRVALVQGESALQLGVFAAPRSEGIWDEVRAEISASLAGDGASVSESGGPYGVELRARMRTKDGPRDLRVVGVDGPRWMLRADFHGPAAIDPARAAALDECLRGVVVDRGGEARPVREPLPLKLSQEMSDQMQRQQMSQPLGGAAGPVSGQPATNGAATRQPSPRPRRKG